MTSRRPYWCPNNETVAMLVYQDNPVGIELFSGFYLGYLWGRSFPPKMPSFPRKILSSIQYISNYTEKIIKTRQGWCTHCNISQNCVSKCTRLHLSAYSFQKISGGRVGADPSRRLVAFGHSGLLPQMINPR